MLMPCPELSVHISLSRGPIPSSLMHKDGVQEAGTWIAVSMLGGSHTACPQG